MDRSKSKHEQSMKTQDGQVTHLLHLLYLLVVSVSSLTVLMDTLSAQSLTQRASCGVAAHSVQDAAEAVPHSGAV